LDYLGSLPSGKKGIDLYDVIFYGQEYFTVGISNEEFIPTL